MKFEIIHNKTGSRVIIDNDGQTQGNIIVYGDEPYRGIIYNFLNKDIQVRHKDQLTSMIRLLSEKCIIKTESGLYEIYKASDLYLTDYFIPKFCRLHGYTVATDNFKG